MYVILYGEGGVHYKIQFKIEPLYIHFTINTRAEKKKTSKIWP